MLRDFLRVTGPLDRPDWDAGLDYWGTCSPTDTSAGAIDIEHLDIGFCDFGLCDFRLDDFRFDDFRFDNFRFDNFRQLRTGFLGFRRFDGFRKRFGRIW